jgi:DNA-binding protein HU-beta
MQFPKEKTVSKQTAIDHLVAKRDCTQKEADQMISDVFDAVSAATSEVGSRIMVRGFGTFTKRVRAARQARNPATGEIIQVAERKALAFKPAK